MKGVSRWKRGYRFAVVVAVVGIVLVAAVVVSQLGVRDVLVVRIDGSPDLQVAAEVSDSNLTRYVGLMFREELPQNEGMLFRYEQGRPRSFWMKYTRIPLDIVFIGPDMRVLNVQEAEPCRTSPCPRYRSEGRAQFVLEVNRGLCRSHGIGKHAGVTIFRGDPGSVKQSSITP